jgi:hypothetical protein
MKVLVLTNISGEVIGTVRLVNFRTRGDACEVACIPSPDQRLYEIDVSPEVYAIEDGEEFHRAVRLILIKTGHGDNFPGCDTAK